MIRIMIVDDHPLMRRVVREILTQESDMEIVAEACDGLEAETQATQAQLDVVLMDLGSSSSARKPAPSVSSVKAVPGQTSTWLTIFHFLARFS